MTHSTLPIEAAACRGLIPRSSVSFSAFSHLAFFALLYKEHRGNYVGCLSWQQRQTLFQEEEEESVYSSRRSRRHSLLPLAAAIMIGFRPKEAEEVSCCRRVEGSFASAAFSNSRIISALPFTAACAQRQ